MSAPVHPAVEIDAEDVPETDETDATEAAPSRGYLLDASDEACAKTLLDWWKDGEKDRARLNAIRMRNTGWRKGVRGLQVVQDADSSTWSVRYPLGGRSAPPQPNKLDDLIRGQVAAICADPVALEAEPQTDDTNDRESAAFTTRVLAAESAEGRLNIPAYVSESLDRALTAGSDCTLVDIDPSGGGQQPVVIEAYATAQTVADATTPPPPQLDPTTGTLLPVPIPPLQKRFVAQDGRTLTDDPAQASHMFVPAVTLEAHSPATVQLLPRSAGALDHADGVQLGRVMTLGQAKRRYHALFATLDDAALLAVVTWRPPRAKTWLPPALESLHATGKTPKYADGTLADHALVWVLTTVIRACPSYPDGAYVHVLGEKYVSRATFVLTRPDGARETLDVPVAQLLALVDPDGHPMGRAMADLLGPADEVRGGVLAAAQEYAWRFGRPVQYVPTGSTLKPLDLARRDGIPLAFNAEGGLPVFEQIPPFPGTLWELYDRMGTEMEQAASLPPAAEGYASSSVTSGEQLQRVIEQSKQQMSDLHRHTGDFAARLGRLIIQQMRAHYDVPRLLRFTTDEGAYEAQEWSKTDLGTTADIRIKRGSFTMLPSTAKQALAQQELQLAQTMGDTLGVVRYRRELSGNVAPMLGLEDDPHRRRILRQLAAWTKGPPETVRVPVDPMAAPTGQPAPLVPAPAPIPQQQPVTGPDGLPVIEPTTGQPMTHPTMVTPPDPVTVAAAQCFAPIAADEEPAVASGRWYEMSRVMATVQYEGADPRWRAGFDQAYRTMRQAAGVKTLAEQEAAQAQQQQADAQAKQATANARQAYAAATTQDAARQAQQAPPPLDRGQ